MALSPFVDTKGDVYLPASLVDQMDETELSLIVSHERAHYRRGDTWAFWAFAMIDCLFWFNPFIRKQTGRCRLACELACDAIVTQSYPALKKTYASTIIKTLKIVSSQGARQMAPTFLTPKNGEFTMRIENVLATSGTKLRRRSLSLALVATVALPFAGLQSAVALDPDSLSPDFSVLALDGRITSKFGPRKDPVNNAASVHNGIDIKGEIGTPIAAPADGTVTGAEMRAGYGNLLTLDHGNGFVTRYAQLDSFEVNVGDRVTAGQIIARVGNTGRSTGPHLHLEVLKDGEHVDPATVLKMPARQ